MNTNAIPMQNNTLILFRVLPKAFTIMNFKILTKKSASPKKTFKKHKTHTSPYILYYIMQTIQFPSFGISHRRKSAAHARQASTIAINNNRMGKYWIHEMCPRYLTLSIILGRPGLSIVGSLLGNSRHACPTVGDR